jgi:hypothetical protein
MFGLDCQEWRIHCQGNYEQIDHSRNHAEPILTASCIACLLGHASVDPVEFQEHSIQQCSRSYQDALLKRISFHCLMVLVGTPAINALPLETINGLDRTAVHDLLDPSKQTREPAELDGL